MKNIKDKCLKLKLYLTIFLRSISVGKYDSILYSEQSNKHSSIIGGILTLMFGIGLLYYASIVFRAILYRESYNLE